MAPSTRLRAHPERRVDYGNMMPPTTPASSARNPVMLEDMLPLQEPATRPTKSKTKEKDASNLGRAAQGHSVKSDSSAKPKSDRKKVVKSPPPKKEIKKARPTRTECIICATTKISSRCFKAFNQMGMCDHFESICDLCIQKLIKTKISERQLADIHLACVFTGCHAALDHEQLKAVLSPALFATWDTAITKHLIAADPSYIACLNPKCGVQFSIEDCGSKHKTSGTEDKSKTEAKKKKTDGDKATCPHCDHDICLVCTRPWHSGSCNSVKRHEDKLSEKAIRKMGAKACPQCGVNIEKRGGCHHMKCQRCRHNFCWECLGPFTGNGNGHAETCSHRRPMIANDIGNFVHEGLTVEQINNLIDAARQDRDAGRVPRPNLHLGPGMQVVNGVIVTPAPPPLPPNMGGPVAQDLAPPGPLPVAHQAPGPFDLGGLLQSIGHMMELVNIWRPAQ